MPFTAWRKPEIKREFDLYGIWLFGLSFSPVGFWYISYFLRLCPLFVCRSSFTVFDWYIDMCVFGVKQYDKSILSFETSLYLTYTKANFSG